MPRQEGRKILYLAVTILGAVLLFILIQLVLWSRRPIDIDSLTPDEAVAVLQPTIAKKAPIRAETLPTETPKKESEGGVDMQAAATKASIAAIEKLSPNLPYTHNLTIEGRTVTVSIPQRTSIDAPWNLAIDVYPIDFEIPRDDPQHSVEKLIFLQGANNALDWIRSFDVDPTQITVSWGPRAPMQRRAQLWLSSP